MTFKERIFSKHIFAEAINANQHKQQLNFNDVDETLFFGDSWIEQNWYRVRECEHGTWFEFLIEYVTFWCGLCTSARLLVALARFRLNALFDLLFANIPTKPTSNFVLFYFFIYQFYWYWKWLRTEIYVIFFIFVYLFEFNSKSIKF